MRKTQLVLLTFSAAVLAGFAAATPAAAREYPWCAQGGEYDYPGECAYNTYEQCQASVSGRLLVLRSQSAICLRPRDAGTAATTPARAPGGAVLDESDYRFASACSVPVHEISIV
ncbi:DUF3551 domain-containing protein [Bradyrhizobium betae]